MLQRYLRFVLRKIAQNLLYWYVNNSRNIFFKLISSQPVNNTHSGIILTHNTFVCFIFNNLLKFIKYVRKYLKFAELKIYMIRYKFGIIDSVNLSILYWSFRLRINGWFNSWNCSFKIVSNAILQIWPRSQPWVNGFMVARKQNYLNNLQKCGLFPL